MMIIWLLYGYGYGYGYYMVMVMIIKWLLFGHDYYRIWLLYGYGYFMFIIWFWL